MDDTTFDAAWQRYGFGNNSPSGYTSHPLPCEVGDQFRARLQELLFDPLGADPSTGQIAQAKFLLQEEWHAWRRAKPGHDDCLLTTYLEQYERLQGLELTRRRPNLISEYDRLAKPRTRKAAPPPTEPAPPPQYPGIFLGERGE